MRKNDKEWQSAQRREGMAKCASFGFTHGWPVFGKTGAISKFALLGKGRTIKRNVGLKEDWFDFTEENPIRQEEPPSRLAFFSQVECFSPHPPKC